MMALSSATDGGPKTKQKSTGKRTRKCAARNARITKKCRLESGIEFVA